MPFDKVIKIHCLGLIGAVSFGSSKGYRYLVTGLFLSNNKTIGLVVNLLALELREASRF